MYFASLLIFLFLISGCNKPDPNPHLADYIYQDIQRKLTDTEKLKSTHETNYEELSSKSKSTDKQTREYRVLLQKAYAAKWEIEKTQQKINYFKMLLFEREKYVKKSYIKAFSAGEKWDNSEELRLYKKSSHWEYSISQASKTQKDTKSTQNNGGGEGHASPPSGH